MHATEFVMVTGVTKLIIMISEQAIEKINRKKKREIIGKVRQGRVVGKALISWLTFNHSLLDSNI